jgi:protein SCO1/2
MNWRWVPAAAVLFAGCKKREPFEILTPPPGEATPQAALHPLWQVPDFTFTERSGRTVTRADLLGKVWVADFFYTTCPGPCPMMTSRLSALQEKLGDRPDVRLVSISLDPAKDTPEVLKQYAERFKAGANWLFLTGDKATTHALAREGFKTAVAEERNSPEPITHGTKLSLIDRAGWVRGLYEGVGEDQTGHLLEDIARLEKE